MVKNGVLLINDFVFYKQKKYEEAIKELGKYTKIAIVKIGKNGSLISYDNKVITINSYPAKAIDTTGAGDTFAAGFLYGGSVDSSNASDFLSKQEISGVLVGGASLDRQEFVKILKIGSL